MLIRFLDKTFSYGENWTNSWPSLNVVYADANRRVIFILFCSIVEHEKKTLERGKQETQGKVVPVLN
jgi:hypothetical protein